MKRRKSAVTAMKIVKAANRMIPNVINLSTEETEGIFCCIKKETALGQVTQRWSNVEDITCPALKVI